MYLVVLNVDPHSPTDTSWGIRVFIRNDVFGLIHCTRYDMDDVFS